MPVNKSKNKRLKTCQQLPKWFQRISLSKEFSQFFMKKLMMKKIGELGKLVLILSFKLLSYHLKNNDRII
jgi:hypothetical protein